MFYKFMILLYENVPTIFCYYFVIISGLQDCQQITSDPMSIAIQFSTKKQISGGYV